MCDKWTHVQCVDSKGHIQMADTGADRRQPLMYDGDMEEFLRRARLENREDRAAWLLRGPEMREKLIAVLGVLREVFGSNDKFWMTTDLYDLHFLDDVELAGIETLCFQLHRSAEFEIEQRKRERRRLRKRKGKVAP
jgi:hypothetical protein